MDITPFLELKPAPRAIFDSLPERKTRARFMLPTADGSRGIYDAVQQTYFLANLGLKLAGLPAEKPWGWKNCTPTISGHR